MKSRTQRLILTLVVAIIGFASIFVIESTADTYMEVAKAESLMKAELVDLSVVGNTVILTFRFNNESTLDLVLINVQFNMYGNTEYVGNYDMRERIPLETGETDVKVEVELIHRYVVKLTGSEYITLQEYFLNKSGEINWLMMGAAVIELPFGDLESYNVRIREQWVSA